ncbi:Uncharacterized protein Adt_31730 [Abeliophyllum distichum]|uniref:Myb/SANT-like domain-containing protein n=1 Tax=Abeliophyllum distichum TaxID=126358 RepID=A0ABD1RFZ1_9LAMI
MERMGLELNVVGYNSLINEYVEKENLEGVQKALQMINGMDNNKESGDSHQGKYKVWTVEESNELLHILVDAANRGWRNSNGSFSKLTVIYKILPALNEKLGCQRTFSQCQSRMKWFKNRYTDYWKLLHHSSGFGWDPVTKKFTASDEVWNEYIKSNVNSTYRTDAFVDYEDLRIIIGNGTAIGRHAITLGNDTDARTFETQENRGGGSLDNFMYDSNIGVFIQSDTQETLYESASLEHSTPPLPSQPMSPKVPLPTKKQNRSNIEAKSVETNNIQLELMDKLTQNIDKLTRSIDSIGNLRKECRSMSFQLNQIMKCYHLHRY